jgi:hypothetical protein
MSVPVHKNHKPTFIDLHAGVRNLDVLRGTNPSYIPQPFSKQPFLLANSYTDKTPSLHLHLGA